MRAVQPASAGLGPSPAGAFTIHRRWSRALLSLAYFTGLTVALTWPLAREMSHSVVDRLGDNLYFVWLIGWFEKAIFTLHQSPFSTELINYPEGWNLASSEISPLSIATALPFSIAAGPVLGYNVTVLLSFILSGFFASLWVYSLTKSPVAALVAGTIFAFAPYRIAHYLGGRLHILATQWLPVYFMGLYAILDPERPRSRASPWLAGVGLGAVALSSQYYLYMSLVLSTPLILLALVLGRSRAGLWEAMLKPLLVFGAVAAPLVLLGILPYMAAARAGVLPLRDLAAAVRYSASPTDYVLPFTGHPVFGEWIGAHFDRSFWEEASLYLGVSTGVLAGVAILRRKETRLGSRTTSLLAVITAVAVVLSLGVTLHWLSRPVQEELPPALHFLQFDDGISISMPGSLLYRYFPFYTSIRVPMRYAAFVILFAAVLAGSGAEWLTGRFRGKARTLAWFGVLMIPLLEFLPPRPAMIRLTARPVDEWLAAEAGKGAVAEFPLEREQSQESIYHTITHGKPFVGSLATSFQTPQYRLLISALEDFPSVDGLRLLRDLNVRYIVVDSAWYEERHAFDDFQAAMAELGFASPIALGDQYVFILDD